MREYRFHIYFILCGETYGVFHTVTADSYQKAYGLLLNEIPTKYTYDYFRINPRYRVNGKIRIAK